MSQEKKMGPSSLSSFRMSFRSHPEYKVPGHQARIFRIIDDRFLRDVLFCYPRTDMHGSFRTL
jgi:hypothetical protein